VPSASPTTVPQRLIPLGLVLVKGDSRLKNFQLVHVAV